MQSQLRQPRTRRAGRRRSPPEIRASGHQFWADEVSLTDTALFRPSFARGHRQVTDVYSLGLAHRKGGRLVSFDRSIPLGAVSGAVRATLEVIGPVDED